MLKKNEHGFDRPCLLRSRHWAGTLGLYGILQSVLGR